MFRLLRTRKAQTTLEYAILIGVIVGGLIATQVYLKRGYMGKVRESADSMGTQFSPDITTNSYTTTSSTSSNEKLEKTGVSTTTINNQQSSRTGNEQVAGSDQEKWWQDTTSNK